jgi:hypothetical protein
MGWWWWLGTGLLGVDLALWALMLLGAVAARRDRRFWLEERGASSGPLLTILIPARDEAGNIGAAVRSALAQDYGAVEVIVMDDSSTDGTAEEAREAGAGDSRLRVLTGAPLEPGWKGKPWALWQAQQQARGELLLFVDADVRLAPWAARSAVAALLEREVGLLSAWGTWVMEGFWVQVALPVVGGFVRGAHPLDRVNDPAAEATFANGQFILMRRAAYDQMGGHAAVASEVLEDVRLAQAARRAGVPAAMLLGPGVFQVRLYTTLSGLWWGMVKNFYAGMGGRLGVAAAAALFVSFTALFPAVMVVLGAWLGVGWWVGLGLGIGAVMVGVRSAQRSSLGDPWWSGWLHPLGALVLLGIITLSAWRGVRGRTTRWKGRPV